MNILFLKYLVKIIDVILYSCYIGTILYIASLVFNSKTTNNQIEINNLQSNLKLIDYPEYYTNGKKELHDLQHKRKKIYIVTQKLLHSENKDEINLDRIKLLNNYDVKFKKRVKILRKILF